MFIRDPLVEGLLLVGQATHRLAGHIGERRLGPLTGEELAPGLERRSIFRP
jgi:hypothetical protein